MKLTYKIGIVNYNFNDIIKEWIKDDSEEQALQIIERTLRLNSLAANSAIIELIIYAERKMGNQICQHIEYINSRILKNEGLEVKGDFDNEEYY